ncbi:MAG: imidazoleglycerol-phosphate dehydratase HisB [Deltaproteobacteria bacterium]
MTRSAHIKRSTRETDIDLKLCIDGSGKARIRTGVPFLDHMLVLWTVHGLFDLDIEATGDIEIDDHHTVEDVGICLGLAFRDAMSDPKGITRYGSAVIPMDEALVQVDLDLSRRPFLYYDVPLPSGKIGTFDAELVEEFLRAFAMNAGITIHIKLLHGKNGHHICEAVFKALGRALDQATTIDKRRADAIPSSKGAL